MFDDNDYTVVVQYEDRNSEWMNNPPPLIRFITTGKNGITSLSVSSPLFDLLPNLSVTKQIKLYINKV